MNKESKQGKAAKYAYAIGMRVTETGEVIGVRNKILHTYRSSHGKYAYRMVSVNMAGVGRTAFKVCYLQAYQKFGNKIYKANLHVRHLNGNSLDDSITNIDIGTPSENMLDKPRTLRIKAARIAAAKLRRFSMAEILRMRKQHACGSRLIDLSRKYNISKGHMHQILNKQIYKY